MGEDRGSGVALAERPGEASAPLTVAEPYEVETAVVVDADSNIPPPSKLIHWFHCYAATGSRWREAFGEHMAHLRASGLDEQLDEKNCVIVGGDRDGDEAYRYAERAGFDVRSRPHDGAEQETLNAMLADLAFRHFDLRRMDLVLYAHTKGAHDPSAINLAWRTSMLYDVVDCWRSVVARFYDWEHPIDAAGPHWLTPEEFGEKMVPSPFFGGNFWWARAAFLQGLPAVPLTGRHEAEAWIGRHTCTERVANLRPGWPGFQVFG
jgi:hypothetical protein